MEWDLLLSRRSTVAQITVYNKQNVHHMTMQPQRLKYTQRAL